MIDWSQIVLEISARKGIQMATLARQLNSDGEHIRRLARGDVQEPKFSTGIKLLRMHNEVCPKPSVVAVMAAEQAVKRHPGLTVSEALEELQAHGF